MTMEGAPRVCTCHFLRTKNASHRLRYLLFSSNIVPSGNKMWDKKHAIARCWREREKRGLACLDGLCGVQELRRQLGEWNIPTQCSERSGFPEPLTNFTDKEIEPRYWWGFRLSDERWESRFQTLLSPFLKRCLFFFLFWLHCPALTFLTILENVSNFAKHLSLSYINHWKRKIYFNPFHLKEKLQYQYT